MPVGLSQGARVMASSSDVGTVLYFGAVYTAFILFGWGMFGSALLLAAIAHPAHTAQYLLAFTALTFVFFGMAAFFIAWTHDRVRYLRFFRRTVDLYAFGGRRPEGTRLSGIPERYFGLMGFYSTIKWTAIRHVEEHLREDCTGMAEAVPLETVMKDLSRIFANYNCAFRTLNDFLSVKDQELETRLKGLRLEVEDFLQGTLGKKAITGPAGSPGALEDRIMAV
jgi:hypothetical protein